MYKWFVNLISIVVFNLVFYHIAAAKELPWLHPAPEKDNIDAILSSLQANQMLVKFTGTGGVYLHTRDVGVMGDPFYTNPSMGQVILLRALKPNQAIIDKYLPPTDKIAAILVGHGHYDHLLDAPYILTQLPRQAKLVGSKTVNHLLKPLVNATRLLSTDDFRVSGLLPGRWIQIHPLVRVLAIESEHPPLIVGYYPANGQLKFGLAKQPRHALQWQSGKTLNYVIDFLSHPTLSGNEPSEVMFRVFYQSSASASEVGFPPNWLMEEKRGFDLAILSMGNFQRVKNYPTGILRKIKPKQVLLIHWERFWRPYEPGKGMPLPGLDIEKFLQLAHAAVPDTTNVVLPQVGASLIISSSQNIDK